MFEKIVPLPRKKSTFFVKVYMGYIKRQLWHLQPKLV